MRRWWWVVAILLLAGAPLRWGAALYTDWLWFQSLGYEAVLLKVWTAKALLLMVAGGGFFLLLWLNGRFVEQALPFPSAFEGTVRRWFLGGSVLLSLLVGIGALGLWEEWLLYRHAVPFPLQEPIFQRDVGFYLFRLPFLRGLYHWLFGGLFLSLMVVLLLFIARGGLRSWSDLYALSSPARGHLSLLGALVLLTRAWGYWLDRFELLTRSSGAVFGVGYTDAHVRIPLLHLLMGTAGLCAVALLLNLRLRRVGWLLAPLGLWLVVALLGGGVLPSLYQRLVVIPNEMEREAEYLRHNIAFTRFAFGLHRIREQDYEVEESLTLAALEANRDTVENIRLWDETPLLVTFAQLQEIRPYYAFLSVDNDRYLINGRLRQVALSPREMEASAVPGAKTWINQHLIYTHGYGLCVAPVNEATEEGLPRFFLKDIPPVASADLKVARPEIYFGEADYQYVLVRIRETPTTREFDYPAGEQNVYTRYAGHDGIPLGGPFRRALFALRFRTVNLLLTRLVVPETRILFYRNIRQRVQRLAPFLEYDQDPYMVINEEGRLFWVLDAYTVARSFPYSEPFLQREPFLERDLPQGRRLLPRGINYIRNAVKATVDAYHGTVTFYISDSQDPLIQAYARIFPQLFRPQEDMPPWLLRHRRYPQDLFLTQALVYRRYHMTDPQMFYNQEDLWALPKELYAGTPQLMVPYYVVMRLPEEKRQEFLLMLPFTPTSTERSPKHNLIAWMAARCDGENYGQVLLFRFPKRKLIYGPMQIEARIDQDPYISSLMTLWHQRGSQVLRGNLLVIPVDRSLLYVEPLYLTAEARGLPELKRVIAAYGDRLTIAPTLNEALRALFEERILTQAESLLAPAPESLRRRVEEAWGNYRRAQQALAEGDFEGYGEALQALEKVLSELRSSLGSGG